MPIIYKLTAPNGKIYIGQTVFTLDYRWKQHVYHAKRGLKSHSFLLGNAIRKYGADSFKTEVLVDCKQEDLNMHEKLYVEQFKSNNREFGYNLTSGGDRGFVIGESTKKQISETLRKTHGNNLPEYLIKCGHGERYSGYSIKDHPRCARKRFCGPPSDDAETLKRALAYLDKLNNPDFVEEKKEELPKYISYSKTRGAYCASIRLPDGTHLRKSFRSTKLTREERRQKAIDQLEAWKKQHNL